MNFVFQRKVPVISFTTPNTLKHIFFHYGASEKKKVLRFCVLDVPFIAI